MKIKIIHTEHAKQRELERNSIFGCPPIVDIDFDIRWGLAKYRMNKVENVENDVYIVRGRQYRYVVAINRMEKEIEIVLITILYRRNHKKNEYRKYSTMTKQQIKLLIN